MCPAERQRKWLTLVPVFHIFTDLGSPKAQGQICCLYPKDHTATSQIFIFSYFPVCDMLKHRKKEIKKKTPNQHLMWAKISWEDEVKDKQMNQQVLSPFWIHLFFLVQGQDLEAGLLTVGRNGTPDKRFVFPCPGVRRTPENSLPQWPQAPPVSLRSIQPLG